MRRTEAIAWVVSVWNTGIANFRAQNAAPGYASMFQESDATITCVPNRGDARQPLVVVALH
jgi:hypothetical protein